MKTTLTLLATLLLTPLLVLRAAEPSPLDRYNIVWDSPSKDAHGSMPLGNGDVGINAWVEPSGDLVFYISKTDAWDENGRLCKVGRVRVKFDPPLPVTSGFRQELKLRDGIIEVAAGKMRLALWVDANVPVVRLEAESETSVTCRAAVELWRLRERPFGTDDDNWSGQGLAAAGATVLPDVVVPSSSPSLVWYHQNTKSIYPLNLKVQHLEALKDRFPDPLLGLTFGARLSGQDFVRDGAQTIRSAKPAARHELNVTVLTAKGEWLSQIERLQPKADRPAHTQWWREFWERSWIFVEDPKKLILPQNQQPWRVGVDSDGGSKFGGEIHQPSMTGRELSPKEVSDMAGQLPRLPAAPAKQGEAPELQKEELTTGCTVAAWIKPAAGEAGRIIDKTAVGASDGFLFDTYPGLSLRWIVGPTTMTIPNSLKPGEWQHVAATVDEHSGTRRIFLNGKLVGEEQPDKTSGNGLTGGYVLQRFMNACSGRGGSPIKFNGSIFNVEAKPGHSPETPEGDPDWRRWGGNYWFQNTRLAYWPMLACGDFEMLEPWFQMYRQALPLNLARIETYYGFKNAAQFPETIYWWGLPNNSDYGWTNAAPEPANGYIRRYWNGGLELTAVMLDRYDFTQDERFARVTLVPLAEPLISFFDQYWPKRDTNGKIIIDPAQSLETYHVVVNPMPEIAGLRFLLPRLLALPETVTTKEQRARWTRLLGELPPIAVAEVKGQKLLRPAEKFSATANFENPELYAVFPYRIHGAGRPDLEMARDTYKARLFKLNYGWCQDSIHAACLGLADEAAQLVTKRAEQINNSHRFPAMWGPNSDWIPDQDHGNNILTTLQCMLLQSHGRKIYLLPAWPKHWSCSFKLHAPYQTTVEGKVVAGKVTELKVTPESRRTDVEVMP